MERPTSRPPAWWSSPKQVEALVSTLRPTQQRLSSRRTTSRAWLLLFPFIFCCHRNAVVAHHSQCHIFISSLPPSTPTLPSIRYCRTECTRVLQSFCRLLFVFERDTQTTHVDLPGMDCLACVALDFLRVQQHARSSCRSSVFLEQKEPWT
jgi:hypothetical protein